MRTRLPLSLMSVSAIAVLGSAAAAAQEQGRVMSTTPVIQQVAVPRQVCTTEQVSTTSQGNKSGGGALIGGVGLAPCPRTV
ncbi:MAG: hypothetical protein ACKO1L_07715 [Brachymonas sp.]